MRPEERRDRSGWRQGVGTAALALLTLLALPVIGVLLFFARAVLLAVVIVAAVAGVVAFAASRRFRSWLSLLGETTVSYKGLRLATDVALGPGHVWSRVSGPQASVGLDDLAQAALGPVDTVELPEPGHQVLAGEPLFRAHHGRRSLTGRSPVNGTVVAVNEELRGQPGLLNASPFGEGWAVRVEGEDLRRQRRALRRGMEARELFRREVDRLLTAVAAAEGVPTLADGGEVVAEIHRHIDDEAWNRLRQSVFAEPGAAA